MLEPAFLASYFITQKSLVPKDELPGTTIKPEGHETATEPVSEFPEQAPDYTDEVLDIL